MADRPVALRWDLSRLADENDFAQRLSAIAGRAERFAATEPRLASVTREQLADILVEYRAIGDEAGILYDYAMLRVDADTDDAQARSLSSQAKTVITGVHNAIRFLTHWWKSLDDARAAELLPALGPDAYGFEHARRLRAHALPIEQERIISIKDANGTQALTQLHDMIEARQRYRVAIDGVEKALTDEELRSRFSDIDPAVRKGSYEVFYATRAHDRELLAEIYRDVVLDWVAEQKLRGYASPISVRNAGNDLPDAAVQAHLDACAASFPLWHRFLACKARLLGGEFSRFDLFAPLPGGERTFTFDDSVRMTLAAFEKLSPRMGALAREVYAGGFIDAMPRTGKRGGAYCAGITPSLPPFLLYNFTGTLRDVLTTAHETGHAVHCQLARHHGPLSFGHAIPIAETASTFAELLVAEQLLADAEPSVRRAVLCLLLDELFGSIGRQSMYTRFEIDAHRAISDGATTTELSGLWRTHATQLLGPAIPLPEMFKDEWLAIGHFVRYPFYCYGYSFGCLLSLSLLERYRAEPTAFVPRYEAFLAAGKTLSPKELCAILDADVTDPAFWQEGFAAIARLVDELERAG